MKIYEAIELHNNNKLKIFIDEGNKIDWIKQGNKSLLYTAIKCNNFDAFKISINKNL